MGPSATFCVMGRRRIWEQAEHLLRMLVLMVGPGEPGSGGLKTTLPPAGAGTKIIGGSFFNPPIVLDLSSHLISCLPPQRLRPAARLRVTYDLSRGRILPCY